MVSEATRLQHGDGASMSAAALTAEYLFSLQQAFSEVFDVELVPEDCAAPEAGAALLSAQL